MELRLFCIKPSIYGLFSCLCSRAFHSLVEMALQSGRSGEVTSRDEAWGYYQDVLDIIHNRAQVREHSAGVGWGGGGAVGVCLCVCCVCGGRWAVGGWVGLGLGMRYWQDSSCYSLIMEWFEYEVK